MNADYRQYQEREVSSSSVLEKQKYANLAQSNKQTNILFTECHYWELVYEMGDDSYIRI